MSFLGRFLFALTIVMLPSAALAQNVGVLRVTVQDETQYVLPHAVVTLVDPSGVERQVLVNESGVAEFTGLVPGQYQIKVEAEGFYGYSGAYTVRRGNNAVVATMPVAIAEQVDVSEINPDDLRDKGFSQTLSQEVIDSLSDDPDEMAEQLQQMAGPGAQIFVDGFRGGRLPTKEEIQTVRLHTNSYAAEYHDAGQVRVEIITKPGMGNWRSGFNFGFRDESLNAKNQFATVRGPEQTRRFSFNSQGPIQKGKTSISFSADGNMSYDSQTIVAQTPSGPFTDQVQRPVDTVNFTGRLEQALGGGNTLRAEYSRRTNERGNLGVGDFDLAERGYDSDSTTDTLRLRNTKVFGRSLFSEMRLELARSVSENRSYSNAPTLRVLDAFTSGGAGQAGAREGRQFTLAQNFDLPIKKHQIRFGGEVNGGWWNSTTQSNANGTFTFSTPDDFAANRPRTYTRRVGDPTVQYSQYDLGLYLQDDFRLTKNINLSVGLRQEVQTHMDDSLNLAPRGSFAYALRKGTIRGGYGMFFDWLDANIYEQTIRVDGLHQLDETIINPSYPDPGTAAGTMLPPSRIQLGPQLTQPTIHQASLGYERPIGRLGQFRADYMVLRGTDALRSININAPVNGIRPSADAGNVTQIESSGRRDTDRVSVGLNLRFGGSGGPLNAVVTNVNYQWSNTRTFSDGALSLPSDNSNPDADWGPASQDVRHRVFGMINSPIVFGIRAGMQVQWSSALPYNITTGRDDNGDTVFNDRPAGVSRNSARGADQWNASLRLNRSFNLGGLLAPGIFSGPTASGNSRGAAGGSRASASAMAQGPGGGGGGPVMIMNGGPGQARYRLDLYASISNLFNATNLNQFVGNQLSPYFGQATSAAPPRKIELGLSLSF
jgi:hypothetical protein